MNSFVLEVYMGVWYTYKVQVEMKLKKKKKNR